MNDTEILTSLQEAMRVAVRWQHPASPRLLDQWADWIDQERRPERRTPVAQACIDAGLSNYHTYTNGTSFSDHTVREALAPRPYPPIQRFWRCEHWPSAIDNWHAHGGRGESWCEHGCEASELRSWDNGTCKPQTSLR